MQKLKAMETNAIRQLCLLICRAISLLVKAQGVCFQRQDYLKGVEANA